jgi:hypothetical protein
MTVNKKQGIQQQSAQWGTRVGEGTTYAFGKIKVGDLRFGYGFRFCRALYRGVFWDGGRNPLALDDGGDHESKSSGDSEEL